MRTLNFFAFGAVLLLGASVGLVGCSDDEGGGGSGGSSGSGGSGAQGGSAGTSASGGTGAQGGSAGTSSSGGTGGGTAGTSSTGGSAGAATGGTGGAATGGSAGSSTGGTGGTSASAAEAFCAKYETECGYGGTDDWADQAACIAGYEASTKQSCLEEHLQNAINTPAQKELHCTHAAGQPPCNG
ncbi:MAG: hypothetical protein R3B07_32655 [Polyangiaceae bacterium]